MKKPILIKFGDNDFHRVFIPLLNYIGKLDFDPTKEELAALINYISPSFHLMGCMEGGNLLEDVLGKPFMPSYLHLTNITCERYDWGVIKCPALLYGDEVDEFFKQPKDLQNSNSDTYVWYPGSEAFSV